MVEAFQPAGFAIDVIAARHPAARVRPADLDAVALAWTTVDHGAAHPTAEERAESLADQVLAALLVPSSEEIADAA